MAWLNPNDNFDLFEGDIILGKEDIRINDQNGLVLKSVHPFYHWPNGIVPYTLGKNHWRTARRGWGGGRPPTLG